MNRVLIAGCGYVGRILAARLSALGVTTYALSRGTSDLPAGVVAVTADLTRLETLRALPIDLDALVYSASPDRGAGGYSEPAYRAAYIDGLANLVRALGASLPRRLVFTSSTGVYAQNDGSWVDETSPTIPEHFGGRVLLEAETAALACAERPTVVRFGGIYGPGRTRLIDMVRAGRATVNPQSPRYTNRIHRDDCAGVIQHLLALDEPEALYLGVDREPAPRHEVLGWIAERLGRPAPTVGDAPSSLRGGSKRCSNARLLATGFELMYPSYREGYGALIDGDE